jgi:hypothetical protein
MSSNANNGSGGKSFLCLVTLPYVSLYTLLNFILTFFMRKLHLLVEPRHQSSRQEDEIGVVFRRRSSSKIAIKSLPPFHKVFRKRVPLPNRQYYRNITFDPIGLTEWLLNLNEDECDPTWRRIVNTSVRLKNVTFAHMVFTFR